MKYTSPLFHRFDLKGIWKILFPLSCLACVALVSSGQQDGENNTQRTKITTVLSNGREFPLVGIGVGNLSEDRIIPILSEGIENLGCRLIDTAHASHNEAVVRDAIDAHLAQGEIHVVTKVWYTHLGYERTKLSVQESLKELKSNNENIDIRVHILLHWPRCSEKISWMDCEGEEARLPQYVKDAGPPPHLDKEFAWRESWKALEDMYLSTDNEFSAIASIGVSNFEMQDLEELVNTGRVAPHILQTNVWAFVFDPFLVQYCQQNQIHLQVYNVMNGILSRYDLTPNAFDALWSVIDALEQGVLGDFHPSQLILAWLVQNGVSVIPRTSQVEHLADNSPIAVEKVPPLSEKQQEQIQKGAGALLTGRDMDRPAATFTASSVVNLFWTSETGEEVPVKERLQPDEEWHTSTSTGHIFVAYDESRTFRKEFLVQADFGDRDKFHVEL